MTKVGEVYVDVVGKTGTIEADFERIRKETAKLDKAMEGASKSADDYAKELKDIDRAIRSLANDYDPLMKAQIRYYDQLLKIDKLERANVFTKAQVSKFTKAAKNELDAATKSQTKMGKFAAFARGHIVAMGLAAAAAAGTGLALMVKASFDTAKNISDLSAKLGVSVETLQRWQYVASQSGVEAGVFETGLDNLGRAMGRAASGAKRETELFQLLGVSLKDAEGKARSLEGVLPDIADSLQRVADKNQRAALAQILFGNAAADILPALEGGSDRINALSDAADRLGIVMSAEQIAKLDEAAKKTEALKQVLAAKIAKTVADNADSIMVFTNALSDLAETALRVIGVLGDLANSDLGRRIGMSLSTALPMMREIKFILDRIDDLTGDAKPADGDPAISMSMDELRKATAERDKADANPIDASSFLKNSGSTTNAADRAARRAARDAQRFQNEIATMQSAILRETMRYAKTAEDQARISEALLGIERDRFEAGVQTRLVAKQITEAQADELRAMFDKQEAAKLETIQIEKRQRLIDESLSLVDARVQNEADILDLDSSLARTRKEQKENALELLALSYQQERLALRAIIESETASAIEKQIAQERLQTLAITEDLNRELIERDFQSPVDALLDRLTMNEQQLAESMERVRAARLEDRIARSGQMADDISEAFANVGRDLLDLRNPLAILKSLLLDLTSIFNEEVLIRPLQEFARQNIGGPLAEQATGAPAGPEAIWIKQLGTESFEAAKEVDQMRLAATRFAQGQGVMVGQLANTGSAADGTAEALDQAGMAAVQFGGDLGQVLAQLLAVGGDGGGGFFSQLLGVGLSAIGGGASPNAALTGDITKTIAANPGIFHDGGIVGPNGMPKRMRNRKLGPREHMVVVEEGERITDRQNSQRFAPLLEGIASGTISDRQPISGRQKEMPEPSFDGISDLRMPDMPMAAMAQRIQQRTFVGPTINAGGIHIHGAKDERSARRSGKQAANELNRRIAIASRKGYGFND